jgi:phosphatidylserine/phosphatidylglycerophosphate/cardiolipin synthase-like enzyme
VWLPLVWLLAACDGTVGEPAAVELDSAASALTVDQAYDSGIWGIPNEGAITDRLYGMQVQACANLCDGRADCTGFYAFTDWDTCQLYGPTAGTSSRNGPWSNIKMYWKKKTVDPLKYDGAISVMPAGGYLLDRLYGYLPHHCADMCDARSDCSGFYAFTDWDTCQLYGPTAQAAERMGPWSNVKMYWKTRTDSHVSVYEHGSHQGVVQHLRAGRHDMTELSVGNDSISSLKVPAGWRVTLFEHGGWSGASKTFTADAHWVGNEFNDRTSSIEVEPPRREIYGEWTGSGGPNAYHDENPEFIFEYSGPTAQVVFDLTTLPDGQNSYLYLLDKRGNILAEDDNSGANFNARLTRTLSAGSYRLIAATASAGVWADFTLKASLGNLRYAPKVLEVKDVNSYRLVWKDSGSGAHRDGAFYSPNLPAGYYALGDYGQSNYSTPTATMRVVRALEPGALASPSWYQFLYNDRSSGADMDGAFWRPVPPPGYDCLGIVVKGDYADLTYRDDIRCVRSDLVTGAYEGSLIWSDQGRHSPQARNLGAWEVMPKTAMGLHTGTFAALAGENPLWCEEWGCGYSSVTPSPPVPYEVVTLDRKRLAIQSSGLALSAIAADLSTTYQNKTWGISQDNTLDPQWLMATPANIWGKTYAEFPQAVKCTSTDTDATCNRAFNRKRCSVDSECGAHGMCRWVDATVSAPGEQAQKLCVEHSWELWNNMYKTMVSAERYVDVTALKKISGPFEVAARNAVGVLSRKSNPPVVRFLLGDSIQSLRSPCSYGVNLDTLLGSATAKASGSTIQVHAASMRFAATSWNHSKIVAVDGREVLSGGHNTWEHSYLGDNPVFDVSMRVRGSAAANAHRYVNALWEQTWALRQSYGPCAGAQVKVYANGTIQTATSAPPAFNDTHKVPNLGGSTPVLAVGRLSSFAEGGRANQSDAAILALLRQARQEVYMSLQDLGPPNIPIYSVWAGWPKQVFAEIGNALRRGVTVRIVLSNPGATYGHSYDWTPNEVLRSMYDILWWDFPSSPELKKALCKQLHLATLRYSATQDEYPFSDVNGAGEETGRKGIPNHAKSILVDNKLFFISSQNLYTSNLAEFGYIVEDATLAANYYGSYWQPLWQYSQRTKVSGFAESDAGYAQCMYQLGLHDR